VRWNFFITFKAGEAFVYFDWVFALVHFINYKALLYKNRTSNFENRIDFMLI